MKIAILLIVCFILFSCNVKKKPIKEESATLNASWFLKEMNGEPTPNIFSKSPKMPQLQIDTSEMKVSGNDGCNSIFGSIENWNANVLTFKNLGGTKMACANMERSMEYSQALSNMKTYKIENSELHLFDAVGNEVLIFRKSE